MFIIWWFLWPLKTIVDCFSLDFHTLNKSPGLGTRTLSIFLISIWLSSGKCSAAIFPWPRAQLSVWKTGVALFVAHTPCCLLPFVLVFIVLVLLLLFLPRFLGFVVSFLRLLASGACCACPARIADPDSGFRIPDSGVWAPVLCVNDSQSPEWILHPLCSSLRCMLLSE